MGWPAVRAAETTSAVIIPPTIGAWMLHIMDYETGEDVNNWFLRGSTVLAFTTMLSRAWLLWFAFPPKRRKAAGR